MDFIQLCSSLLMSFCTVHYCACTCPLPEREWREVLCVIWYEMRHGMLKNTYCTILNAITSGSSLKIDKRHFARNWVIHFVLYRGSCTPVFEFEFTACVWVQATAKQNWNILIKSRFIRYLVIWPDPTLQPTQPPIHPPMGGGASTDVKFSNRIEISWLGQGLFDF